MSKLEGSKENRQPGKRNPRAKIQRRYSIIHQRLLTMTTTAIARLRRGPRMTGILIVIRIVIFAPLAVVMTCE